MNREILNLSNNGKISTADQSQYDNIMKNIIEPMLNNIKVGGYFERKGKVYYEQYNNITAKKSIVISHGFAENVEKYKEMIYYFYISGYDVFMLEHRGHGRSVRECKNYSFTHVSRFEDYVEDFNTFIEEIVKKESNGKELILYAHSMGGAIGAAYIEKYPKVFKKAILSAPMLRICTGKVPIVLAKIIADINVFIGKGKHKLFVHSEFNKDEQFEDSCATSVERYKYYFEKRIDNELLHNYCGSYSWLRQSIIAGKKILRQKNINKIETEIMLFQAESDTVVDNGAQDKFVERCKWAKLVFVPEAKHEIFMANTNVLTPYLDKIFDFIN